MRGDPEIDVVEGSSPRPRQELADRPRDRRENDIVDRAAERLAHRLHVAESDVSRQSKRRCGPTGTLSDVFEGTSRIDWIIEANRLGARHHFATKFIYLAASPPRRPRAARRGRDR